jgi:hypothetical protein
MGGSSQHCVTEGGGGGGGANTNESETGGALYIYSYFLGRGESLLLCAM